MLRWLRVQAHNMSAVGADPADVIIDAAGKTLQSFKDEAERAYLLDRLRAGLL